MKESPPAKHKILRDELLRAIRVGEFRSGQRLPPDRELASRFSVTQVTVRKAMAELVASELLERRLRLGTFVRDHSQERLSTVTLNLIGSVGDSSLTTEFLKYGTKKAAERGWRTRITRSQDGYEAPLVRAVALGDPSLIFLNLPNLSKQLCEAMVQANGRAVMIGNRMDQLGVPSVMADDDLAVRIAVSHLRAAGHERIAFLGVYPDHPVVKLQVAAWKACFASQIPNETLDNRLIFCSGEEFQSGADMGYEAMSQYLKRPGMDITALVANHAHILAGGVFACQEMNYRVPEDISVICTQDDSSLRYMRPAVSAVDICIEQQVQTAMDIIDLALTSPLPEIDRLHLVQPQLIERNSVLPRQ